MSSHTVWITLTIGLVFVGTLPADLKEVMAELNLERRSKLALEPRPTTLTR
jgi:hypothetical protein